MEWTIALIIIAGILILPAILYFFLILIVLLKMWLD
jgi:hypothetical protein